MFFVVQCSLRGKKGGEKCLTPLPNEKKMQELRMKENFGKGKRKSPLNFFGEKGYSFP